MSLSTQFTRVIDWVGSIRNIFRPGNHESPKEYNIPGGSPSVQQTLPEPEQEEAQSETEMGNIAFGTQDTDAISVDEMKEPSRDERMEAAKRRFPGAADWAQDELRLFEILFSRQDSPLLPSHWSIDFCGVPLPEVVFATSNEHPPVVYAHSVKGSKEFNATTSIMKLVDLTSGVRPILESNEIRTQDDSRWKRSRVAALISDKLNETIRWAARDGGYNELKIVPNVIAEVVQAPENQKDIVRWMTGRMAALVRLQQEFLRDDRNDDEFWTTIYPALLKKEENKFWGSSRLRSRMRLHKDSGRKRGTETRPSETPNGSEFGMAKRKLFKKRKVTKHAKSPKDASPHQQTTPQSSGRKSTTKIPTPKSNAREPVIKTESPDSYSSEGADSPADRIQIKKEDETSPQTGPSPATSRRHKSTPASRETPSMPIKQEPRDSDDDEPFTPRYSSPAALLKTPLSPHITYRRKPPVVYGLFVLGATVMMLTADASRGPNAYISFHLDISFADSHQSVWNALTVAIIVCAARDELRTRLQDFEPLPVIEDSDPDA